MECILCLQGRTAPGTTTCLAEPEGATIVVKEVPAEVCEVCGEPYVPEPVAARLEQIVNECVRAGAEVEILRYTAA